MYIFQYLPFLFSNIFRVCSYVFLQIIPTRLAQPVLPTVYLFYLLTTWLCPPNVTPTKPNDKSQNGAFSKAKPLPRPLLVLAFSLPTQYPALTWTNILINTLLLISAADFVFTPFFDSALDITFTRVGAVYPDSVKIVVRYPEPNDTLCILYRETASATPTNYYDLLSWKEGPQLNLTERTDWVDTIRLSDLWPSTAYEYILATSNKTVISPASDPIPFRTFPDPRLQSANRFRFIATSCLTPNFPYRGPFSKHIITGFDLLAEYLQFSDPVPPQIIFGDVGNPLQALLNDAALTDAPNATNVTAVQDQAPTDFMLFLGDFIYADVPVYIGDDKKAYERLYRRNYKSPSFRKIYERLPIFHVYDDHEFIDNYAGKSEDVPPFANATGAYDTYAGNANYDSTQVGQNFYDFRHGDVAFFVMDTRRYRAGPADTSDPTYRTMLGEAQLSALYSWLHAVNATCTFKFVVSSVPFTSLWAYDAQVDSWAGYADEKAALLAAFHAVPNVVLVSGDRHEFAAIEFASPEGRHVVREISTSPLNMFYIPFVHTLKLRSEAVFVRNVTGVKTDAEGNGAVIDVEEVPYEKVIAYIPEGNSKWSTFEIDTTDASKPTLRIETVIDGKPAYHLEIVGVPAKAQHSGLGSLVTTNVKDLFDKIGLRPSKWF